MIQRTEISSTHKQHALLSSTSPWLFAPLSNKQPRNLYQRVLKQQNEAIFLHLIMCVAGHQDYKDYLVKAWCRWLDGVGTTTKKFGNAEASERYLVYLGSSVFAALKFFFFFLEYWPAICVHVQYRMIVFFPLSLSLFFVKSLPKKHSLHLCSVVSLHISTWVNPNNQVGEMCERVTQWTRKNIWKTERYRHIKPVCWSIINGCEWKEGKNLQRTSEGWRGWEKIGIDCRVRINWTPPFLVFI